MMVPGTGDASSVKKRESGEEIQCSARRCGRCRVAVATAPKKHKMTKEEADAAEVAKQHDNTLRFLRDGVPLILPSWLMPVYFGMHIGQENGRQQEKGRALPRTAGSSRGLGGGLD
jgi:hypothetical protein